MLDKVWFHLFSCSCSFKLWLLKNRMDDLRHPSAFFLTDSSQSEKVLSNVLRVFFLTPTFPPKRKKPQLTTRHSYNWFYVLLYHCKTTKSLNQYKHKRTMYSYLKMFLFFIYTLFPVLFSGLQGLIQYPKSGVRHSTSTNRSVTWMVSLLYTLCHVLNIAADTINTWFFFSETRFGKISWLFSDHKKCIYIFVYSITVLWKHVSDIRPRARVWFQLIHW